MNNSKISNPASIRKKLHPVFWAILGVMFLFLFVGGPDYYSSRLFRQVWDIGHIIFFSLFIYALLSTVKVLQDRSFIFKAGLVVLISVGFGLIIEILQIGLDRSSELDDVIRDLLGGLIPLVFVKRFAMDLKKGLRIILQSALVLVLFYCLAPLLTSIVDEINAKNQFPVLSDFETSFETSRWSDELEISKESTITAQGQSSLKIILRDEEYSGISLKHFPGDWRGFSSLKFSIYNTLDVPLTLEFRLNDAAHIQNSQEYHDRYNSSFNLKPGWNNLEIDLIKVMNSPQNREMDMSHISMLRIFVSKLNQPVVIYLDNFYLTN